MMPDQPMSRHETRFMSISEDPDHPGWYIILHNHPMYQHLYGMPWRVIDRLQPGEIEELHTLLGSWLDVYRKQREESSHGE